MTTIKAFITRHAVPAYFIITFAISWGGVLLVIGGFGRMSGTTPTSDPRFPFAFLAMLAGPSIAGILLSGLVHGRAGLREFRSRLLKWQVGARWYAVALLAAPLLAIAVLVAVSPFSRDFLPGIVVTDDKGSLLLFGLAVALGAGFFEELGWTGFAVPELRRRYGVLTTGIIVGVLWGAWHLLVVIWGLGDRSGALPPAVFIAIDTLSFLPAFRVLMVWVYDRTDSLLLGMVMHTSLTASTLIWWPVTRGRNLLSYDLAFAAAVWIVVIMIAMATSGHLSRQPLRRRVT